MMSFISIDFTAYITYFLYITKKSVFGDISAYNTVSGVIKNLQLQTVTRPFLEHIVEPLRSTSKFAIYISLFFKD